MSDGILAAWMIRHGRILKWIMAVLAIVSAIGFVQAVLTEAPRP